MQDKILDLLKRKEGYISGDQLSQKLDISRQALWKHIQELKEKGYEIIAVPHLGYQLISSADRLFDFEVAHGLGTKFIGKKIYYFESLPSTMDTAWELGLKGAPEGTLVLSEQQTRGRGRIGRSWVSAKHKGIYLSLILKPKMLPAQASILTLLAAVSTCEAIGSTLSMEAKIKWPNDILLKDKKLGGILTELNAETDKINFVVIGLGLNVNNDKKSLPPSATSLKEHKKEHLSRVPLLQEILRKIEENYLSLEKGEEQVLKGWREYSITLGRRIRVCCQKQEVEGEAVDIDTDGGLLVRKDSGLTAKVMAGDVVHCR
ncbi:MAG TPA: biotin--[acetyl-CoA-carboxylase] ligase [Candidatus Margulisiibacteriota bacterium]|nr:biotin--[acetyl-CoA-carboxylase] ligase [Candidatus Margulisiibacteriota bacterium]